MKRVLSLVLALVMVLGSFSFVAAANYDDVANTVYETAVDRLSTLGILEGYPDGSFKPEGQITRAEFAAVAIRAKGLEGSAVAAKGLATGFTDVAGAHWASGYVGTAAKLGIVNGVGNGMFAPEAPVKYEEAITMLVRALGYEASAQAKGGYPYGYLIVANENGLLDKVKGTQGQPATRGIVAQLADNALEVPMMVQVGFGSESKWVISGTKEHGGDERYLLDDLGFDNVEGIVTGVNTKTKKVTVEYEDENEKTKTVTLKVEDGFDFYSVEGLETKFWYKDEVVVVYVVQEEAKFDAVEYDSKEKEFTLVGEDENYEIARGAVLELDGNSKVKPEEFNAHYAKVVLNEDNEVRFAQGYTLEGFILVEEVDGNVAVSFDDYDEINLKDFTVVKDGKTIGLDGIEEEDILFYNRGEKFAVVYNEGTEGTLDRVFTDNSFRFEGTAYDPSDIADPLYFDEGKVGALDQTILKDFLDDEVEITVFVDFAGNVVLVAGEVVSAGDSAYGVLLSNAKPYTGRKGAMIALDLRNGEGNKVSYDIAVEDIGVDIKLEGLKLNGANDNLLKAEDSSALDENTVLRITADKKGEISKIELLENHEAKEFKVTATNVKDKSDNEYRLQAGTLIFHDGNDKVTTIGNAKDKFETVKTDSRIYVEKGRVVAVVGETNVDADTKNITGLVTDVRELSNNRFQFTIKEFGTTKRLVTEKTFTSTGVSGATVTQNITALRAAYEDQIVTFKVGEKSEEIREVALKAYETLIINKISGRTITDTNGDVVELNNNAKIYEGTKEVTISKLKTGQTINVYFQGNSKRFVDYVMFDGTTTDDSPTGLVTYINGAGTQAIIGDEEFDVIGDAIALFANVIAKNDKVAFDVTKEGKIYKVTAIDKATATISNSEDISGITFSGNLVIDSDVTAEDVTVNKNLIVNASKVLNATNFVVKGETIVNGTATFNSDLRGKVTVNGTATFTNVEFGDKLVVEGKVTLGKDNKIAAKDIVLEDTAVLEATDDEDAKDLVKSLDWDIAGVGFVKSGDSYYGEFVLVGGAKNANVESIELSLYKGTTKQATITATSKLFAKYGEATTIGGTFVDGSDNWNFTGEVGEDAPDKIVAKVTFKTGIVKTVDGELNTEAQ